MGFANLPDRPDKDKQEQSSQNHTHTTEHISVLCREEGSREAVSFIVIAYHSTEMHSEARL